MPFRIIPSTDQKSRPSADEAFVFGLKDLTLICAPDRTGIVEGLIDGYGDLPHDSEGDDEAFLMRYDALQNTAAMLRELILGSLTEQGRASLADFDDHTLPIIWPHVSEEPLAPYGYGGEGEWTQVVPLVLIRTDYKPFTEIEVPTGNILFLDPYTETSFIQSLERVGFGQLMVREGSESNED